MGGIEALTTLITTYDQIQIYGNWSEYLSMVIASPDSKYASSLLIVDLFSRIRRATKTIIIEEYHGPVLQVSHICVIEKGKVKFIPV